MGIGLTFDEYVELKVTEGTVRHRIETLGPRLIKAGFGKEDLSSNERGDL